MTELELTGLDGSNPLGYMAALGVQRVLHERGRDTTLRWIRRDAWRPVLGRVDRESMLLELAEDVKSWREHAPELELSYEKTTKKKTETKFEIKPPPALFQQFAHEARKAALGAAGRRWSDYAAAYAAAHADQGVDGKGWTKPTALHFMAGQQLFLQQVISLMEGLVSEVHARLAEALFGPWRYDSKLAVLGWDLAAGERDYALRAEDPSGDKKFGVPGADWLAFRALPLFPVVLSHRAATTTAFDGTGKRYTFYWALWESPVAPGEARTIVGMRWDRRTEVERRARGVVLSLKSNVRRTDQGGYGSFSAASPT